MLDTVSHILSSRHYLDFNRDGNNGAIFYSLKGIYEGWGIKFYPDVFTRDHTYGLQLAASRINCGPFVGDKFDILLDNENFNKNGYVIAHGYITECIVKTVYDHDGILYPYRLEQEVYKYRQLIRDLSQIMTVADLHGRNVGYMPDGRLVAIDFGECALKRS